MLETIKEIQELLKLNHYDGYIITISDDHLSEYVSDYYQGLRHLCGFTGSAGTLAIEKENAYLWVDGRYHLQATLQEEGTGVTVMKLGLDGVETVEEYAERFEGIMAMDGIYYSYGNATKFKNVVDVHWLDETWKNRPEQVFSEIYDYDIQYCGESRESKIKRVLDAVEANYHLLASLDDIVWTFNIRADDIPCNPVALSYALLSKKQCILYCDPSKVSKELEDTLAKDNVILKPYLEIYEDVKTLEGTVQLDESTVNYRLYNNIGCTVINKVNPAKLFKIVKNDVEIRNTIEAHKHDGIAMTEFSYWVKHNYDGLDEVEIADYLEQLRRKQGALDLSFDTICGYDTNGAIIHYKANKDNKKVVHDGVLLVDSGGQYLQGTTDITRTYALGKITDKNKMINTLVLKAHLALLHATFKPGTTGGDLDKIVRDIIKPYDFMHGTGHGVGHFLNVHETPVLIRKENTYVFVPGNISSDEPGIYLDYEFGVRIENEMLCVEHSDGTLGFQSLTYCPYDLDLVDISMLNEQEIEWINDYHQMIYDTFGNQLTEEVKQWVKDSKI